MIDLENESPIRLNAARNLKCLQRDGQRPDPATLWRWAKVGILRGGERVRLETLTVGRYRCTTREAAYRFIEKLSGISPSNNPRTSKQREREIRRAELATVAID
jgi:hypothetical protein